MPIELDKILKDISSEKSLLPSNINAKKQDIDEAWARVGRNNKLSVHEARSIFKVLQKKYDQEKNKPKSTWKLFSVLEEIHTNDGTENKTEEPELPMEEEEEFEMLEVQEDEELPPSANNSSEEGDSMAKQVFPSSDKEDAKQTPPAKFNSASAMGVKLTYKKEGSSPPGEEKKLLNTLASASPRLSGQSTITQMTATATALRHKGIFVKKTSGPQQQSPLAPQATKPNTGLTQAKSLQPRNQPIQLPDTIKRKLLEDSVSSSITVKKQNTGQQQQALNSKANNSNRRDDEHQASGINVITIPGRSDNVNGSTGTTTTTTIRSENGFSPRIEDIDFRNDIIFEAGPADDLLGPGGASAAVGKCHTTTTTTSTDIINLGNFDNSLPPTFFKNLCNSSRHEALGLYVANVMNRLKARSAAKLELSILRAVIDAQCADFDK